MPKLDFAVTVNEGAASLPPSSPDNLAMICYTSGGAGQPKGVLHTHRNLLHDVQHRLEMTHLTADDRMALLAGTTEQFAIRDSLSGFLSRGRRCLSSI